MEAALPRKLREHCVRFFVAAVDAERADCSVDDCRVGVADRRTQCAKQLRIRLHERRECDEAAQVTQLSLLVHGAARADRVDDATAAHALLQHGSAFRALQDRRLRARADLDQRAFGLLTLRPSRVGELAEQPFDLEHVFPVVAVDAARHRGGGLVDLRHQRGDLLQANKSVVGIEALGGCHEFFVRPFLRVRSGGRGRGEHGDQEPTGRSVHGAAHHGAGSRKDPRPRRSWCQQSSAAARRFGPGEWSCGPRRLCAVDVDCASIPPGARDVGSAGSPTAAARPQPGRFLTRVRPFPPCSDPLRSHRTRCSRSLSRCRARPVGPRSR